MSEQEIDRYFEFFKEKMNELWKAKEFSDTDLKAYAQQAYKGLWMCARTYIGSKKTAKVS
jgi:hypothetical protein